MHRSSLKYEHTYPVGEAVAKTGAKLWCTTERTERDEQIKTGVAFGTQLELRSIDITSLTTLRLMYFLHLPGEQN